MAKPLLLNKICKIYHEKFQLDQIQNGRPAAIFEVNMHNEWKTLRDS